MKQQINFFNSLNYINLLRGSDPLKILLHRGNLSLNANGVPLEEKSEKLVSRGLVKSATVNRSKKQRVPLVLIEKQGRR